MVGKPRLILEEVLTEKQILHILHQAIGGDTIDLKGSVVKPASDGIAGFLGDHMKAVLDVDVQGERKKVHLFIKRIPPCNKAKADFIDESNYFRREMTMFRILEEICEYDPNPWCVKAYVYTDTLMVMPDLSLEGYAPVYFLDTLDLEHALLATTTIARFHAAVVNYETKKATELKRPYSTLHEVGRILEEPTFCESPWLRACSKLSNSLLKNFSAKSYRNMPDIQAKLTQLYIDACDSLTEYDNTVNTLLHKDLWVNNIMFKHKNEIPVSAVLVDYQCLRYGPPAFDLMTFLYLATDRQFRQEREKDVFDHYYSVFINNLSDDSKRRIDSVGYSKDNFVSWCEKGRMFGMTVAICIFPFVLMDPLTAQKAFDDPDTYEKYTHDDRSEPVVAHAHRCESYKNRNLEVTEEFVETYVL